MTRYAYNPSTREIHATWSESTRHADTISLVATTDESVEDSDVHRLLESLARLSNAAWDTYAHRVWMTVEDGDIHFDNPQRFEELMRLDTVCDSIRNTQAPSESAPANDHTTIGKFSHEVGQAMLTIGSTELTEAVVADIEAELSAIEAARAGVFAGRSAQALQLTTTRVVDVHVVAASEIFATGEPSLAAFEHLEPSSVAVAAAHWVYAASVVAGKAAKCHPVEVIYEADGIDGMPVLTVSAVVSQLSAGYSPHHVVASMISKAQRVATGTLYGENSIYDLFEESYEATPRDSYYESFSQGVFILNPLRPALNILEDMIDGVEGAWLVYDEYTSNYSKLDETAEDYDTQLEQLSDKLYKKFLAKVQRVAAALPML